MSDIENLLASLKEEEPVSREYPKPVLMELSDDEIEEIHTSGMITPKEMFEELKDMNYCPYTNGCSRCQEFENCDDCLIDHVNTSREWVSYLTFVESLFEDPEPQEAKKLVRE